MPQRTDIFSQYRLDVCGICLYNDRETARTSSPIQTNAHISTTERTDRHAQENASRSKTSRVWRTAGLENLSLCFCSVVSSTIGWQVLFLVYVLFSLSRLYSLIHVRHRYRQELRERLLMTMRTNSISTEQENSRFRWTWLQSWPSLPSRRRSERSLRIIWPGWRRCHTYPRSRLRHAFDRLPNDARGIRTNDSRSGSGWSVGRCFLLGSLFDLFLTSDRWWSNQFQWIQTDDESQRWHTSGHLQRWTAQRSLSYLR